MIKLKWVKYKLYPYEKDFAIREIVSLLNPKEICESKDVVEISEDVDIDKIKMLTYFEYAVYQFGIIYTNQYIMENSFREKFKSGNRQVTRYSVHGIHEYKGKFNPQVVRALLNILHVERGETILDPFCGSGTSLVESQYYGVNAVGTDINKLAVFISNTKIKALNINATDIDIAKKYILKEYQNRITEFDVANFSESNRIEYLKKWFPEDILNTIECLRIIIEDYQSVDIGDLFKVTISNILRDYSLQEPADFRIRKRKSPFPEENMITRLSKEIDKISELIDANIQNPSRDTKAESINCDIRDLKKNEKYRDIKFKAAITSPPYATALPYIDTQRLSLVWLNFCEPQEIMALESSLIGSRELNNATKMMLYEKLNGNLDNLPKHIWEFCIHLQNSLSVTDGFRRKNVPIILYRYFSDMKVMFDNVKDVMDKDGLYALIVGHNHTVIGGEKYDIDTPKLLLDVALQSGWTIEENIPLETYMRYGIHHKNSIAKESLIILKNI